jgi:hypothetical protein
MLMLHRTITSEAVRPEQELDQPEEPRVAKRRQSSSPDPSTKRPRLSTDGDLDTQSTLQQSPKTSPQVADSATPAPKDANLGRRESNAQEERKRGRRLFGGLLNTLSQSTSNAQQKKRLEIEKRQQEKARLQKAEDESRRAERLQKLKEVRMREQVKFDEQSVSIGAFMPNEIELIISLDANTTFQHARHGAIPVHKIRTETCMSSPAPYTSHADP